MSSIFYVVPIVTLATLWLYFLTCISPEVSNISGKLSFPTSLLELKDLATLLGSYYKQNSFYVFVLFCSAYLYKQAFIIPGSVFMNVLAGALFGVLKGFPLCCLLTASGATACYLMSRAFGSSVLQQYFPSQIKFLKEKVSRNSDRLVYYLLFLRLFPMSPNWLINLLSPIVGVPLHVFFFTVLIGLMPYNFLCVQAGGMLATLRSMDDVLSFTTLLQLAAMAAVALGPSFILKRKQSFRDSFDTSENSEKKTL
ncbi:transmembrane protein 41A-like [Macrosteles quadrilineatus]|uniref:transmembrane protein 41A-like n=1 Tax=Macrosteles quadrilineatus TaxID=74068 RepID=UPI0023E13C79|nr:transmembrane protein 41A-like [Macrosteles quadrilineatus]